MVKIAISGKMCSGKSFCSNMIINKYPYFKKYSLAGKLKEVAHDLFFDRVAGAGACAGAGAGAGACAGVGGENNEKRLFKNRELYVSLGQHMKEIDRDVWVNHVLRETRNVRFAVVDDLRFKNEMDTLKTNGWKMVRINVSKDKQLKRLKETYSNYHDHIVNIESLPEIDLDDVDDSEYDLVLGDKDVDVDTDCLMKWLENLMDKPCYNYKKLDKCCNADCSDCNSMEKMNYVRGDDEAERENSVPDIFVDFEKYIKDNGVIC